MSGSNGGHNGANPALTPDQVETMLQRQARGETWTALAKEYGVTVAALIYHKRKAEAMPAEPVAGTAPATDDDLAAIITVARHARGVSDLRDLLDSLGLTPLRVVA